MSVFTFVVGQPHHTIGTLQRAISQSLKTATFSTALVPDAAPQPHPISYHLVLGLTFPTDEEGTPVPCEPPIPASQFHVASCLPRSLLRTSGVRNQKLSRPPLIISQSGWVFLALLPSPRTLQPRPHPFLPRSYLANLTLQLVLVQLHTVLGEREASRTTHSHVGYAHSYATVRPSRDTVQGPASTFQTQSSHQPFNFGWGRLEGSHCHHKRGEALGDM